MKSLLLSCAVLFGCANISEGAFVYRGPSVGVYVGPTPYYARYAPPVRVHSYNVGPYRYNRGPIYLQRNYPTYRLPPVYWERERFFYRR